MSSSDASTPRGRISALIVVKTEIPMTLLALGWCLDSKTQRWSLALVLVM